MAPVDRTSSQTRTLISSGLAIRCIVQTLPACNTQSPRVLLAFLSAFPGPAPQDERGGARRKFGRQGSCQSPPGRKPSRSGGRGGDGQSWSWCEARAEVAGDCQPKVPEVAGDRIGVSARVNVVNVKSLCRVNSIALRA